MPALRRCRRNLCAQHGRQIGLFMKFVSAHFRHSGRPHIWQAMTAGLARWK
jgi:hypothetical protein